MKGRENMLFKSKKSVFGFLLAMTLVVAGFTANTYNVSAEENKNENQIEELSQTYSVPEEELEDLPDNLEMAVKSVPDLEIGEEYQLPVSDNLILEVSVEDDGMPLVANPFMRATYNRTITSILKLKNIYGRTVVTLKSVGVFRTNGSTSKPIDAYGSHSAMVWNITNKSSVKGGTAYNSYVRNTFTGKFNIGIDPVSMTVQTFSYSNTIYCNTKGSYSSSWR